MSEGECPGRCRNGQSAVAQPQLLTRSQGHGDGRGGARDAHASTGRQYDQANVPRHPVGFHDPLRVTLLAAHRPVVVSEPWPQQIERSDLGPGSPRQHPDQTGVVEVLMGDQDQAKVFDSVAQRYELVLERLEGGC